jgi:hypothetical protein
MGSLFSDTLFKSLSNKYNYFKIHNSKCTGREKDIRTRWALRGPGVNILEDA